MNHVSLHNNSRACTFIRFAESKNVQSPADPGSRSRAGHTASAMSRPVDGYPATGPRRAHRRPPPGRDKAPASPGRDEIIFIDVDHFDARPRTVHSVRVVG